MILDLIGIPLMFFWSFLIFIIIYILWGWVKNILIDMDLIEDSETAIEYLKNKKV